MGGYQISSMHARTLNALPRTARNKIVLIHVENILPNEKVGAVVLISSSLES